MAERPPKPHFTGVRKCIHPTGGFRFWVPMEWVQFPEEKGHEALVFAPNSDTIETSFIAEKHNLPIKVVPGDAKTLRAELHESLQKLPGIEIESQSESVEKNIMMVEARYTWMDNETRRKRWLRIIYSGKHELVMIAQGSTPEEFEYWLPMFYNIMNTCELWPT
jgi:hypothetical protein